MPTASQNRHSFQHKNLGGDMKDHDPVDGGMEPARRVFLKKSGATVAGVGVLSTGALLAMPAETWAQALGALDAGEAKTLLRMTRDVYPHDTLSDAIYQKVVASLDGAAQKDAGTATLLSDGLKDLNAAARRAFKKDYAAVAKESDRVGLLQAIESTPFFQKVRGEMIAGIYNNPDVWKALGYEGASAHLGGYLKRGFDDISWL
jgi:hypothetical protein